MFSSVRTNTKQILRGHCMDLLMQAKEIMNVLRINCLLLIILLVFVLSSTTQARLKSLAIIAKVIAVHAETRTCFSHRSPCFLKRKHAQDSAQCHARKILRLKFAILTAIPQFARLNAEVSVFSFSYNIVIHPNFIFHI